MILILSDIVNNSYFLLQLGVISKGQLGQERDMMVVRGLCTKPGLPYPDRVYALKMLFKIHEPSTLTKVS